LGKDYKSCDARPLLLVKSGRSLKI